MRRIHIIAALTAVAWTASAAFSPSDRAEAAPKLATEEFMIAAADPGTQLFVRNKRPEDMRDFASESGLTGILDRVQ